MTIRQLHRALITLLALSLVAGGVLIAQSNHGQQVGHGQNENHAEALRAHMDQVAEKLNLTSLQRANLETTIERAHELMSEFHQLHADLMAELDAEQQRGLNAMMHRMMSGMMGHHAGYPAHRHSSDDIDWEGAHGEQNPREGSRHNGFHHQPPL